MTMQILVTWRLSWRNSRDKDTSCNQTKIESGGQIGDGRKINIECGSTCNPSRVDSRVICTDFSPPGDENWSSGVNTATFRLNNISASLR